MAQLLSEQTGPLAAAAPQPQAPSGRVSFVKDVRKRTAPIQPLEIEEVLERVRSGTYAKAIERIRSDANPSRRRAAKQRLPAFAFSGEFTSVDSHPGSLLAPSGVIALDIDKADDLAAVRERVVASPHTRAAFVSPSGDGLKVLVAVTPAPQTNREHKAAYHFAARMLGVNADPAASDISRLCFVSHDPDLYSRANAQPLDVSEALSHNRSARALEPLTARAPADRSPADRPPIPPRRTPGDRITVMRDGEKHHTLLHLGGILRHEGWSEDVLRSVLHHFHETHSDAPGDPGGVDAIVDYLESCEIGVGESRPAFLKRIAQTAPSEKGREMLLLKPANEWVREASERPRPKRLLGSLIFEREVTFLFADTNVGKSVLAVQIGDHISRGHRLHPFDMEVEAQKVLYLDCELSDQQFAGRTVDEKGRHYCFSDNFIRAEINPLADVNGRFDEAVLKGLETAINETGARVVIVDNLSYLKSETQEAKDAVPLMKELKRLKQQYELTLLVVAHTPKRDDSRPIVANDLAGSRALLNFADAAFSIGRSSEADDLRYVKQVKVRSGKQEYGERNVALCRLEMHQGLLGFTFVRFDDEQVHLRSRKVATADPLVEEMVALQKQGLSLRQIGESLGVNHMRVKRALDKAEAAASEELDDLTIF